MTKKRRRVLEPQPYVVHVEVNIGSGYPLLIFPFLTGDRLRPMRIDLPALGYEVTKK